MSAAADGGEGTPGAWRWATATDEELVARYVAGDRDAAAAFDRLVARHAQRVYAICLRYFGDPADAEDATQETFVVLLRRASTFRGGAAFSTWLYRVATNACHDLARRRRRGRGGLSPERASPAAAELERLTDPRDGIAARELSLELTAALRGLDADTRAAVVLHDVQGVPYADVAARLSLPVGTVKSRIHRGHVRLAAALSHLDHADGRGGGQAGGQASDRPHGSTAR